MISRRTFPIAKQTWTSLEEYQFNVVRLVMADTCNLKKSKDLFGDKVYGIDSRN